MIYECIQRRRFSLLYMPLMAPARLVLLYSSEKLLQMYVTSGDLVQSFVMKFWDNELYIEAQL